LVIPKGDSKNRLFSLLKEEIYTSFQKVFSKKSHQTN